MGAPLVAKPTRRAQKPAVDLAIFDHPCVGNVVPASNSLKECLKRLHRS